MAEHPKFHFAPEEPPSIPKAIFPPPRRLTLRNDAVLDLSDGYRLVPSPDADPRAAEFLRGKLAGVGIESNDRGPVLSLRQRAPGAAQGYALDIDADGALIKGEGAAGLLYATVSLLQLLRKQAGRFVLPAVQVEDAPELELRGLFIDFRYAWLGEEHLRSVIELATWLKANVIVWWLQDKFAWRSHPDLVHARALSPESWRRLVEFGHARAIHMVPCVDVYGHGETYLDRPRYLALSNGEMGYWGADDVQYCQRTLGSWELPRDLLEECLPVFDKTPFVHLGMDEVGAEDEHLCEQCQSAVRELAQKLDEPPPYEQARNRFIAERLARAVEYVREKGRIPMIWDDSATNIRTRVLGPGGIEATSSDVVPCLWFYESDVGPAQKALARPGIERFRTVISPISRNPDNVAAYLKASREFAHVIGAIVPIWEQGLLRIDQHWKGFGLGLGLGWNRSAEVEALTEQLTARGVIGRR